MEFTPETESNRKKLREQCSLRAADLLTELGSLMMADATVSSLLVSVQHDVHGYYGLRNPQETPESSTRIFGNSRQVLHVQAYPGMSSEGQTCVVARIMDAGRLDEIHTDNDKYNGNEHQAVTEQLIDQTYIPWDAGMLRTALENAMIRLNSQ